MGKNDEPKKKDRFGITLIVCITIIVLSLMGLFIFASTREKIVFDKVYTRAFGSDHIKVLVNGRVYCDSETEEPEHKEDWQYITTLDEQQMEEFLGRVSFGSDDETREYIRENIGCVGNVYR